MMKTLERVWQDALAVSTQFYTVALEFARGLDPLVWGLAGGALLLLLLWALLRRREGDAKGRPEVLLSLGTIGMSEDVQGGRSPQFSLRLTVSNLNAYAVQVLEVALKTPEMDVPVTAEVAAVVPPEGSVTLEEPLAGIMGEEGRLNVYFYTAGSKRIYRLGTSFALEPWNNRYKISPLNQSVAPAKQLASAGVSRVQERAWREGERAEPTPHLPNLPRPRGRERERERTPPEARYPEPTETPRHRGTGFPDEF